MSKAGERLIAAAREIAAIAQGDLIAEAITEQFGERCPDLEPACYCCQAWAQYDALKAMGNMTVAGTHVMVPTRREVCFECGNPVPTYEACPTCNPPPPKDTQA